MSLETGWHEASNPKPTHHRIEIRTETLETIREALDDMHWRIESDHEHALDVGDERHEELAEYLNRIERAIDELKGVTA